MWPPYYWCGGWGIFPVIMIIAMLVVACLVFRRAGFKGSWKMCGPFGGKTEDSETALKILKKRYAKGEITRAEFEQMKVDVSN
jgi:putative membrane protein